MQKYRHKTTGTIIEAAKLTEDNVDALANLAQAQIVEEKNAVTNETWEALNIRTPHGRERLHPGMYLIRWKDVFYTRAPVLFESTYVPVEAIETFQEMTRKPVTDNPWGDFPRITP